MATGITLASTSNLTSGQKILVANAKIAGPPAAPDPELIENDTMPDGHKQRDVLTYARLSQASAVTEGVDVTEMQQLVTAVLSITPSEHGLITTLSRRLVKRQGDTSLVATVGKMLGISLVIRKANDVIAIYDTLTKSIAGAGTPIDITHFRGSVAYLLTDNSASYGPAPMPLRAALHIEQISDIIVDITDPGAVVSSRFGLSEEMLQRWWKGSDRLYSVQIFHSGNVARDASDDSKGALFNEQFAVLVNTDMTGEDVVEEEDKSLRATEYGMFWTWGEGLRADPWGVEVYSDTLATV